MALKSIKKIDIDFYNQKYILVNAKQNDRSSRFLKVTCYDNGKLFSLNPNNHSAFIRYKKADGYSVFNECKMDYDGTITVELTEQMLAVAGVCYADLIVVDAGYAEINSNTGEIVGISDSSILSTMTFCIDVIETAVDNSEIESIPKFDELNTILEEAKANFENVVKASKSWAVGHTKTRDGEDTDNAKYYAEQSSTSSSNASDFAMSANNSASAASASQSAAAASAESAFESANAANASKIAAAASEATALSSAIDASNSADAANKSQAEAAISKSNASMSEAIALTHANHAQSWAIGGTGIRDGENENNARYWAEVAAQNATGNIVVVTSIKGDKESDYRAGQVNITAENVGAVAIEDIATVDEVKNYLGI